MIVPQHWEEARVSAKIRGRHVTVARWGWSDRCVEEAKAKAEQRAADALQSISRGETVTRREAKKGYNGAEGVPIREEIVDRFGDTVITRNSYGARCLNSPNVFFMDIDYTFDPSMKSIVIVFGSLLSISVSIAWSANSLGWLIGLAIASLMACQFVAAMFRRFTIVVRGGIQAEAMRRVHRFLSSHRRWSMRAYETPAGLRLLVLHRTFDPQEEDVQAAMRELGCDPTYMRMCLRQNCFRARVSAKPWRIGMKQYIRPRRGVWPISEEFLPERQRWIAEYEQAAERFAACRILGSYGSATRDRDVEGVVQIHDELCRATSNLPVA